MRKAVIASLVLLAACGDGMTDAEKRAKDEADAAFVAGLQAKDPPPEPIAPQPIGYPEMEEYQIFGARCAFAPGDSIGAILIAGDESAWLKLEGKMIRLASDPGGAKLPFGTWSKYDGKEYSVRIELDGETGTQTGDEAMDYGGSLRVEDPYGQLVYATRGTAQCSA